MSPIMWVKHQRLTSPSSCSGAMSAPSLPHQPSCGTRQEQLSSAGEQGLLATVIIPGARPLQSAQLLSLLENTQNSSQLKEAEPQWMVGFCSYCSAKKATFLAAAKAEEEKASRHMFQLTETRAKISEHYPVMLQAPPLQAASAKDRHIPKAARAQLRDTKLRIY